MSSIGYSLIPGQGKLKGKQFPTFPPTLLTIKFLASHMAPGCTVLSLSELWAALRFVYEIPEEVGWWQKFGDVCNRLWLQVCTRVLLNCMWFKLCDCYFVSFWLFHFTLTSEFCPEIFINFILFHFNFNFSFWALNRLPEAPGTDTSYSSWEQDAFSSLA